MDVVSDAMGTILDLSFNAAYSLRFEMSFGFAILVVWLLKQFAIGRKPVSSTTSHKKVISSPPTIEQTNDPKPMMHKPERPSVLARREIGHRDASCNISPSELCNSKRLAYQVSQLCRTNSQNALEVYRSARQAGLNLADMPELDRHHIFNSLVPSAIRSGSVDDALQLLQDLREHGPGVEASLLSSAVKLCTVKHYYTEAISAYKIAADNNPNFELKDKAIWSCLLFAALECKLYKSCPFFFDQLKACGVPSAKDYGNMIRFASTQDDWEFSLQLIHEMRDTKVDIDSVSYNTALAACAAADRLDQARELLELMEKAGDTADVITYNVLMNGYAKAGHLDQCFELYEHMAKRGISPSQVTYGILLDACVNENELGRASQVFDNMSSSGCTMNTVIYTTLIKGFARAGELDRAMEVYEQMRLKRNITPDLITFSILIKANCDGSRVEAALRLLEEMKKFGLKPDEVVFNNLLTGCARQADLELGKRLYKAMTTLGIKPSNATFSIMVRLYAQCKQLDEAVDMLKKEPALYEVELEARLFSQLAQSCIRERQGRRVLEVYEMMLCHSPPTAAVHGSLLGTCIKLNMFETGAEILAMVASRRGRVNPADANALLEAALKKRKVQCAKECVSSMKQLGISPEQRIVVQLERLTSGA